MFSNEQTLHRFTGEKAEGQFHDRYEKALEQVRSEFGRIYTMMIGGREVRTPSTVAHTSPIDTRIVLGHMPNRECHPCEEGHCQLPKEAFERWGIIEYGKRVQILHGSQTSWPVASSSLPPWVSI